MSEIEQHKFQISNAKALGLQETLRKTADLGQRNFNKLAQAASSNVLEKIQKGKTNKQHKLSEGIDYHKPDSESVEVHLFGLAFKKSDKLIRYIEENFRIYNPELGYWEIILPEEIKQLIMGVAKKATMGKKAIKSLATVANVGKTYEWAVMELFKSSQECNNLDLIAFKNGTVSVKTGQLSAHSPDNLIMACLPYNYTEGSSCPPAMQRYINSSFGEQNTEYVRAALGLILDLGAPDKFIHCVGASGSGKGVFIRLIRKFFANGCVTAPSSFSFLANPESIHSYLNPARLCVIDDFVGMIGEEIAPFYSAVERSPMDARARYKPSGYSKAFHTRYAIATVAPVSSRSSGFKGWNRRVFPLPTLGAQQPDETLEAELENAIAEIISWALAQDKTERNKIIQNPGNYNSLVAGYFDDANAASSSVWAFVNECCEPLDPTPEDTKEIHVTPDSILFESYTAYCVATRRQPMSLNSFKVELRGGLPFNWVKRQGSTVKTPSYFAYIYVSPKAFSTEGHTRSCQLSGLSDGGMAKFREWVSKYHSLYPYTPKKLEKLKPSEPTAQRIF